MSWKILLHRILFLFCFVYSIAYVPRFLPLFVCVIHLLYCFTAASEEENNPHVWPSSGSKSQMGIKTEREGDRQQISRFPAWFITLQRHKTSLKLLFQLRHPTTTTFIKYMKKQKTNNYDKCYVYEMNDIFLYLPLVMLSVLSPLATKS